MNRASLFPILAIALIAGGTARATRSSTSYSTAGDGLGAGGGSSASMHYSQVAAIGGITGSSTASSPSVLLDAGLVAQFALSTPDGGGYAAWRLATFGTSSNSGSAADFADPDGDGISNLLEFALGLSPTSTSTASTPTTVLGTNVEFYYQRSNAALGAGAVFSVEWSDTLAANSWSTTGVTQQVLSDNGTLQQVKVLVPAGSGSQRFVRLRVTAPP